MGRDRPTYTYYIVINIFAVNRKMSNSKKFIQRRVNNAPNKSKSGKILRKIFFTFFFNELKVFTKKFQFENYANLIIELIDINLSQHFI
jgi:hypothetical protein